MEIYMGFTRVNTEESKDFIVEYYLIENEDQSQYGIGVRTKTDSGYINNITTSRGEATAIIRILKQNSVTPITLKDVICDWIVERDTLLFQKF